MITFRAGLSHNGITIENSAPRTRHRSLFVEWNPEALHRKVADRLSHLQWRMVAEILSPVEEPTTFEVVHAVTKEVLYRSP